ncbi:3-dehydroquinate dehydratase [Dietzia kunjamensis]|uniref:type I 3-dehydroquinate dehydratase n=1 Tax=Dietzia TaxID=37914 RepID=UPI000E74E763|nr:MULTISPECIES: type I 3-dehydroquinate dehydratase [Dietzia]MBB1011373.1 type I 3-dehydroquinate dehydratase [Dietzia kunjamensis]MBS7547799.1 type I 3-dehydroquinate dehydratase [Dietzia massiliensis]MVZ91028.1 type I 3-dehydroquinate dehydratase [Microbacter sp. ANSKLAB05]RKE62415.1 3-dehydroquinate dehydratase [Dietzia kunjamensis]
MPRHQLHLDARSPSIIVPITAGDLTQLEQQAAALADDPVVDLVEWRVDLYKPAPARSGAAAAEAGTSTDPGPAVAALEALAGLLPDTPILATFRTTAEGGSAGITDDAYIALVASLAATGLVAAVDVEHRHPRAARAIEAAHAHGTSVVASNHDFDATPPAAEIVARLEAMEAAGADVAKIAVMPRSAADVVTLIAATESRHRVAGIPLITMSMGALGAVTRIGGGTFGSAATFATVGAASAPGQLPAAGVRAALDLLG